MKKILFSLAALVLTLASCDEHEAVVIDNSLHVGDVVCSNGQILSLDRYEASEQNLTAIAVVYDVDENDQRYNGARGYAVMLREVNPAVYSDSIPCSLGASTDTAAYNGFDNTYKLRTSGHSPLSESIAVLMPTYESAVVPSVAEMKRLFYAKQTINPVLKALGGDILPDVATQCHYWTSTETNDLQAYTLAVGADLRPMTLTADKDRYYPTRPIMLLYH